MVNRLRDRLVWHTVEGDKTVSATIFHNKFPLGQGGRLRVQDRRRRTMVNEN